MSKQDRKSLLRFFNSATNAELETKLVRLLATLVLLKTPDALSDANWMINEIKLELEARSSLSDKILL